ncbi:MAG: cyanophycin synthetase [Burkholderiales bacterium]|nr:cyanophycin synthetase [Burkholderiales bacterium]
MKQPFAARLVAEAAAEMGLQVELEPEFGFVGAIVLPDGRRHLFRNGNLNVNHAGSVEIAKDKGYAAYFLRRAGLRVPVGLTFFSPARNARLAPERRRGIPEALSFAAEQGWPVFVKPNNLEQGRLVCMAVNEAELGEAARRVLEEVPVALVEKAQPGRDYRVVLLVQEVISAYERIALAVVGDGRSTVDELLVQARDLLSGQGRPNAEIDLLDFRIAVNLARLGLGRSHVPLSGQRIQLLDNANLSTGGTSVDVTGAVHPSFEALAVQACAALGLAFAGVDFICADIAAPANTQDWVVLEVNGSPGLDNYAAIGPQQAQRVRDLYCRIVRHLAEGQP